MARSGETTRISTIPRPVLPATAQPSTSRKWSDRTFARDPWGEIWRWAVVLGITSIVGAVLMLGSLYVAIHMQARSDESRRVDAIVVLGTAQYNGRPSPVLRARLDEVIKAYGEGLAPVIVVTGGGQPGDAFTEAEASRDYLVEQGVPESAILLENEGRNSWESMQGAADLLEAEGLQRVLLISDGFHLFRLKMMAQELGLTPFGRPAADSPIRSGNGSESSYMVREMGAVVAHLIGR